MQPITQRDRAAERAIAARQLSERLGRMPMSISSAAIVAADVFGVSRSALMEDNRHKPVVRARWAAMMVAYDHGYSSERIGRRLSKDHTTVLHGVAKARELCASDDEFRRRVDMIVGRLIVGSSNDA